MKKNSVFDCTLLDLGKQASMDGNMTAVESGDLIPFDVKRVYYLYDVPGGESRGAHAHKALYQLLIAASGSFSVTLDDGRDKRTILLNRPYQGLLIVPGIWRTIDDFSSGSVCLCLASRLYEPDDYIRDYQEFLSYRKAR